MLNHGIHSGTLAELDVKVGLIYRWRRELLDKGEGRRGAIAFLVIGS